MIQISEKDFDDILQRALLAGRTAAEHNTTVVAHKALRFLFKVGDLKSTKEIAEHCQCTQKACNEAMKTLTFAGLTKKVRGSGGKWRFCPADWFGSEIKLH